MEKLHSLNILKSSCTNVTVIVLEMYSYKVLLKKKKKNRCENQSLNINILKSSCTMSQLLF